MRRGAGFTGIDHDAVDALKARFALPTAKSKDVRWRSMSVNLTGETLTGEKVAMSLAGEPTRAQLRALLALFAEKDGGR